MELYHATSIEAADAILAKGFAVSHMKDSHESAWLFSSIESSERVRQRRL